MRRDAVCCSTRCRQARHRFTTGVGTVPSSIADFPLHLAYADPPYPGLSKRYYGDHPDFAGEVDHEALVAQLAGFDGWALSTAARSLRPVLELCPPEARVAAWFRGGRNARSFVPQSAWEPVIYFGGRRAAAQRDVSAEVIPATGASRRVDQVDATRRPALERDASRDTGATVRLDALVHVARARTTDPNRVVGAKPAAFSRWVFDLLGALPGDEFVDVFPGSGGVARAWEVYTSGAAL